eukprot:1665519-Pyramimonas_sp.AAC.1
MHQHHLRDAHHEDDAHEVHALRRHTLEGVRHKTQLRVEVLPAPTSHIRRLLLRGLRAPFAFALAFTRAKDRACA